MLNDLIYVFKWSVFYIIAVAVVILVATYIGHFELGVFGILFFAGFMWREGKKKEKKEKENAN